MYKIESFIAMGCAHSLHCEDDFYVYEDEDISTETELITIVVDY